MENEELFKDIPELNRIFRELDREIRYYHRKSWNEYTTKERLVKKRDELLDIFLLGRAEKKVKIPKKSSDI